MENTEKKENQIVTLSSINIREFVEFKKHKEKQLKLVEDNPFIEIVDNKTFELAKKSRTAYVKSRTAYEEHEKLIASEIKNFRNEVKDCFTELKEIALPSEEKQQKEVRRYEAEKQAEKEAKEKAEAERVEKIKNTINSIVDQIKTKISSLKFIDLEAFESIDFQNFLNTDVEQFEEFELEFASKIKDVQILFDSKKQSLIELENQRLENERIAKENAELEEEKRKFREEQQKAKEEADKKAKEEAEKFEAQQKKIKEQQEEIEQKQNELTVKERTRQLTDLGLKINEQNRLIIGFDFKLGFDDLIVKKHDWDKLIFDIKSKKEDLKKASRIKQLRDLGLNFDFNTTYKNSFFFIDVLDIITYTDEKWNDLISKIESKNKEEKEAKEKAEKERIEALKPEKEKAIDFLKSIVVSRELFYPLKQIKSLEIMQELQNFFDEATKLQKETITKINNL